MAIDLEKLSPAPWDKVAGDIFSTSVPGGVLVLSDAGLTPTDEEFIVLARNAFDVMMRRGWYMSSDEDRWYLSGRRCMELPTAFLSRKATPFDAAENMVEADRWMKEREKR